ncbi:MAG: 5'-3' exonuclease H3TH domain-containing protein [Propioniciclava sp.]
MNAPRLLLFDTASLYFRAFHGLPESLTGVDDQPVNAVRGLLDFLARFIDQYSPTQVACCWDEDWRPAWRVELIESYKAHRVADGTAEEVPEALARQVPLIREALNALGLPVVGRAGYEADDIITTLTVRARIPVDVVTGDRDLFQVVDDAGPIRVLYVARGVARHERVDQEWLQAKYGITGAQYVDFAVLRGDPSDGLPGVRGIGEKTAARLLQRYGSLARVLAHGDELTPAVARALADAADYIAVAPRVVAGATDADLGDPDLSLGSAPARPEAFAELAERLRLGGAADRIVAALATAPDRGR